MVSSQARSTNPSLGLAPLKALLVVVVISIAGTCTAAGRGDDLASSLASDIQEMRRLYAMDGVSVTVVRDQEILVAGGFGVRSDGTPYTASTPCGLFSATKVLTAITILALVKEGILDLDALLGDYLADAPESWQAIPLWRLMNHTSGIPMIVNRPEFQFASETPEATNRLIYETLRSEPLDYEPGLYSRYRQSGYGILTMIASDRARMPWSRLFETRVATPAGLTETRHGEADSTAKGEPLLSGAGGYVTTVGDMALLFRALGDRRIVDVDWLQRELIAPERLHGNYGLGVVVREYAGEPTLGHSGGGARANIRYAPASKVGVAVFVDRPDKHRLVEALTDRILRRLVAGEVVSEPRPPLEVALEAMRDGPVAELLDFYRHAKQGRSHDLWNAESALNRLGYHLLKTNRVDDAIQVFSLNTREFPLSGNTYDSLGEAYLKSGDRVQGAAMYERSLELDPGNENAREVLESLRPEWFTTMAKAAEAAKRLDKPILMDVNGRPWCPPCVAMGERIIDTAEFREWARDSVVLLEMRVGDGYDESLGNPRWKSYMEEYDLPGIPLAVFLSPSGEYLGRLGNVGSAAEWVTQAAELLANE